MSETKSIRLRPQSERLDAIEQKVGDNPSQYGITAFDLALMRTLRGQSFRSHKQEAFLSAIEIKVFGHSRQDADVE